MRIMHSTRFGQRRDRADGAGLSVRNYGEGLEVEGDDESGGTAPAGQRLVPNAPLPRPVFDGVPKSRDAAC